MLNQKLYSERQLAKIYTHYVYRNTIIEDFHADGRILDDDLYKKMYRVVYAKVGKIKKYSKYLYLLDYGENITQELNKLPINAALPAARFIMGVLFNSYMGYDWDEAEQLNELPKRGATSYILAGKFKECCDKHSELTDETMCYINKDIHNRIYTLIIKATPHSCKKRKKVI